MAASTPRKTTARKTTARRRPAPKQPVDLGLVLDDDTARAETDALLADREPLFTIGGTTYTVPKVVPPSWTLQAFNVALTGGESKALAFAAEKLLEPEAYEALCNCETLTRDGFNKVMKALIDKLLPDGVLVPKA